MTFISSPPGTFLNRLCGGTHLVSVRLEFFLFLNRLCGGTPRALEPLHTIAVSQPPMRRDTMSIYHSEKQISFSTAYAAGHTSHSRVTRLHSFSTAYAAGHACQV